MIAMSIPRAPQKALACLLAASLAGCSTLPASGPTAGQIKAGAASGNNSIGFRIVEIDNNTVAEVKRDRDVEIKGAPTLASLAQDVRADALGPGDVLSVSVYEVGVGLFGSGRVSAEGFDPSARGENFPSVTVDRDGRIKLPYVGEIEVAGKTTAEIEAMIEGQLKGLSQNPQALVAIKQNYSNTAYVGGDVRKPGRFDLTLQREHLLDAIASAGGAAYSAEDTIVRFSRGGRTLEERLGYIRSGAADDLVLAPGDRVELVKRPRSFIVLGATSRVSQIAFENGEVSLAEAVARAGGPTDATADPSAIFLFRYVPSADAAAPDVPVVYRLNLMKPTSYFLSQRFAIRDKDVIYIGNAAANQPAKLVAIINQLFSPFLTARVIAKQ